MRLGHSSLLPGALADVHLTGQEAGTSIKPLAIVRDPQLEHIDLVIYAVEIRSHGKVDTTEIGKLRTQEHKHLLKSKEYLLEARLGGSEPWQKVKGDIFKPVGSNSMVPGFLRRFLLQG